MTKQIMEAELKEGCSPVSKPRVRLSKTSRETQSVSATQPTLGTTQTEASLVSSPQPLVRAPLKCQWELLSVIAKELLPVINTHFQAVSLNGDPLDPDWDCLFRLERAQSLLIMTARTEAGSIVGYACCSTSRGLFSNVPLVMIDAIWLDPAWREGRRGIKFIKSIVLGLKELKNKCSKIRIFSNDEYDVGKDGRSRVSIAFEAAGFKQVGTMFEMDI